MIVKKSGYVPAELHNLATAGGDMLRRHGFRPTTDRERELNQLPLDQRPAKLEFPCIVPEPRKVG